ncbi:hypothetical protein [Actinomadura rubrisoli]|uniref:Uncharacterized protein n=1 Tax=Actinomadura rubrisoli TaxID=2530368 RepID=A0A4R5ANZ1_9ACTN|nr:hypothetical protein [Actinomadura rubrisoli]TDD73825.1 hypothetical protein E1298_33275 [Actinomadura rubrisoli]
MTARAVQWAPVLGRRFAAGDQVAQADKEWAGFKKEALTTADRYTVEIWSDLRLASGPHLFAVQASLPPEPAVFSLGGMWIGCWWVRWARPGPLTWLGRG